VYTVQVYHLSSVRMCELCDRLSLRKWLVPDFTLTFTLNLCVRVYHLSSVRMHELCNRRRAEDMACSRLYIDVYIEAVCAGISSVECAYA